MDRCTKDRDSVLPTINEPLIARIHGEGALVSCAVAVPVRWAV